MPPRGGKPSLADTHPEIAIFWRDTELSPHDIVAGSTKYAMWECSVGHTFRKQIFQRVIATSGAAGCPECYTALKHSFRSVGGNDLATLFPELSKQWSPRNESGPETYTPSSLQKVWWACDNGHEYQSRIEGRTGPKSKGCAECSGRNNKLSDTYNLSSLFPDLMKEWSPKNTLDPKTLYPGSNLWASWICEMGHEWDARINKRSFDAQNCRKCGSHYRWLIRGVNDLPTVMPHLASEWSTRNERPFTEYSFGSPQFVWWTCNDCGADWEATPSARSLGMGQCSECHAGINSGSRQSFMEIQLAELLSKIGVSMVTSDRRILYPLELDIYFPDHNLAIEFNGIYWHSSKFKDDNYHLNKSLACEALGIQLIHIWEDDWVWNGKRPIIMRAILDALKLPHLMGEVMGPEYAQASKTVAASDCDVESIDQEEVDGFMEENHVSGPDFTTAANQNIMRIGLRDRTTKLLVAAAVATVNDTDSTISASRYATSCTVTGGVDALTLALSEAAPDSTQLVIEVSHDLFSGSDFVDSGWKIDSIVEPDHSYFVRGYRDERDAWPILRFEREPDIKSVPGYTQAQLAELNDFPRVYDSGKIKLIQSVNRK